MEYSYQIFLGTYDTPDRQEDITTLIKNTYKLAGPGDVMLGWRIQGSAYEQAAEIVHEAGKKLWLWCPAFTDLLSSKMPEPTISLHGKTQQSMKLFSGEDFNFVCPTSPHNQNITPSIYREHFSRLPFDGIFIDKIRHASFAGGMVNGLGCFCERCRSEYEKRGVDYMEQSLDFFLAKSDIITESVGRLTDKFDLPIGLDVFAPVLAPWVGQDIPAMTTRTKAEFVKPMMYRLTKAPAGMPFEHEALQENFFTDLGDIYSDESIKKQLDSLNIAKERIWPGFEINFVPDICEADPNYVTSFAKMLDNAGYNKTVLSWNLLDDSGENLKALTYL